VGKNPRQQNIFKTEGDFAKGKKEHFKGDYCCANSIGQGDFCQ
jgi:hypothetical protein